MILTPNPQPFHPGDVVRVLTNAPHGTRLLAGDEVTVADVKTDTEDRVVLLVDTDDGRRALYATDVEIVRRAYRPASPNPVIDDAFDALMRAEMATDAYFASVFVEADTALGAVDEDLAAVLTASDDEPAGGILVADGPMWGEPEDDAHAAMTITDRWGDEAAFCYEELTTPSGETIGRIMIFTDCDGGVQLPATSVPTIIAWLQDKYRRTAQ